MSAPLDDPYLDLPLDGVQLIEASAGTGKTYTLATLVTRLVVERRLRIGQILAVTFTEAATQELRRRIRERLQLCLSLLGSVAEEDESPEAALSRAILQRQLERGGESEVALRRRLHLATVEIDLAAIFTIHGFCTRVLREHALEAGQAFAKLELLANERALREEVAADLWRNHGQSDAGAEDLAALWKEGHAALAKDLPALLSEDALLPAAPATVASAAEEQAMATARLALQQAFARHGDEFLDALAAAIDADAMNRNSYKREWLEELRQWMHRFAETGGSEGHPKLEKLTVEALEKGTKAKFVGKTPASPLSANIADFLAARDKLEQVRQRRRLALLHRLRTDARARIAALKRQRQLQGYDDLIASVAGALDGTHGDALARALRGQYAVALVDEFQDTDARQWRIFNRVFGAASGAPALFLIGDPKQAIYGFRGGDVQTYLDAAAQAGKAPALLHNFRSRPAVLAAIAALYRQAGKRAFGDTGIEFIEVQPGGKRSDADYLRRAKPASALTIWQAAATGEVDGNGQPSKWSAEDSRAQATAACAAAIHGVLSDARAGAATIDGRPVQAGDIAVLVRSHREATRIQQALTALGIPAVAAGKQSLFATGEARELHALLLALLHGGDDGRLRAALATVLLGLDAAAIAALEHDGAARQHWQQQAQHWREQLRTGGPLALIGALCAAQGERLLALLDGERRLSNYLQLAELLQDAQRQALGLHGLVDWLARAIAAADANDEAQLLRLESDARCVQIVTLHKSKGLEYPLVFLPFVGIAGKSPAPGRHCAVHAAGSGRQLHWKFEALDESDWKAASDAWKQEQRAEDARLLYVGLTRAEHALWIACGDFSGSDHSPLAPMLGLLQDPEALRAAGITLDAAPPPDALPRLPPADASAPAAARHAAQRCGSDWWVYSFSQLARAEAGGDTASAATLPAPGGGDEPAAAEAADVPADDYDPRFAGNRFGVALHAAFEHADFAAWRDWRAGAPAPAGEAATIETALAAEGYGAALIEDGLALCTGLIGHTLTARLPEGLRLCELPATARRAEIEFQFALQPVQVEALLALLHAHGIVRERDRFGARRQLEGLMTGLIDLTYHHAGKWYVLDYKSNRLPGYGPAQLAQAMAHSEYDLQALIYTLALHRWLRFRLGEGYDYVRDVGGIRYLFCRGIDAARDDSPGIHAQRFEPALVQALDALFGHAASEEAA